MRILMLTPQLPYPPHQGTSLRNFNLVAQLAQRNEICLLSFAEPDQPPPEAGPLAQLCRWVDTVPVPARSTSIRLWQMFTTTRPDMYWRLWSPSFREKLKDHLRENRFDVVQVEGIEMASYMPWVQSVVPRPLLVYDDHNAEWLLQKRACLTDLASPLRWPAAAYSFVQWHRLASFEAQSCRRADVVVVASEADRGAIQSVAPTVDVAIVPNGVNLSEFGDYQGPREDFDLVFTGKMDFRPNVDAMLWFCREVLPLIRAGHPNVRLAIVGQHPHPRLEPLRLIPGVTITGWVSDVRPYVAGSTVYVAPLRVGGGTRLKLLQAMAMAVPIVATSLGAEGFPVTDGAELMLADDADEFARRVVTLLEDEEARKTLGLAGRAFVGRAYGWETLVPKLEVLYRAASVTDGGGGST